MRAILVGAALRDHRWLKSALKEIQYSEEDLLVGVDGGVAVLTRLKLRPDFAIGDWDSLGRKPAKNIPSVTLSKSKDRSDLYFGLQSVLELGAEEVICFGVTGGRPDHHLAALLDLSEMSEQPASMTALDSGARYHFLSHAQPEIELNEMTRGQIVSLFSLAGSADGVSLKGFSYPLTNAVLEPSSHGLSNEVRSKTCRIKLRSGRMVVMVLARNSSRLS